MLDDFFPANLGLKQNYLYEILATTFSKEEIFIPNTSCMGIRVIENNLIQIKPFPNTRTYNNLKATGIITINFIGDVYLYALAALKSPDSSIQFPLKYYDFMELENPFNEDTEISTITIPFIKKAWAILTCIIAGEKDVLKKDQMGEFIIPEFKLHVISYKKLKDSHKLFNRAENLALESIILATRLSIAKDQGDKSLLNTIHGKLTDNIENIDRFGKNEKAIKAIEVIKQYIKNLTI